MKKIILTISIAAITIFNLQSQTWIQKGIDIEGIIFDEQSGNSVAINANGNIVVIGSSKNDFIGTDAGRVSVFEWNGTIWVQRGSNIYGEAAGDYFGNSVSISSNGNTIAIGAPYNNGNGSDAGHVRIYNWDGSNWNQHGTDIDGEAANDLSGFSVDLDSSGTNVVIGALYNASYRGHVRAYQWNGTAWQQRGTDIEGEAVFDSFGASVSLSSDGNIFVAGGWGNDGAGFNSGHVRVYEWNGSVWVQKGLDINGDSSNDSFGTSVAMNTTGTSIVGGALGSDTSGTSSGLAKVYDWNGTNWIQRGNSFLGGASGDRLGVSVGMNGNGMRVCLASDGFNFARGKVDAYDWNGITWNQIGASTVGIGSYTYFGASISMNKSGENFVAGAPRQSDLLTDAGVARIYDFCSAEYSTITPTIQACSYTSPSGNYTYTASGLYVDTLVNIGGCDSIIDIDLTLIPPSSSITASSCFSYTVPSGNQTYTTNGIYNDTIPSLGGCDSIITISLTIEEVDLTVLNNGSYLQVNSPGTSHQWLDCPALTPISGAVNNVFIPTTVGSYAVIITNLSGCVDTSDCSFINVGLENLTNNHINIYPNPSDNFINISGLTSPANIQIVDALGKIIFTFSSYTSSDVINIEKLISGLYFIQIGEKDYLTTRTFIKK